MKKLSVWFLIAVLTCFIVSAAAIDVTSARVTDRTPAGSEAKFIVNVKNNQIMSDTIKIVADDFSIAPFGDFESVRVVPSQIAMYGKYKTEAEVYVKTLESLRPNKNYIIYMWAKSLTNPDVKTKFPLTLYVVSPQELIDIIAEFPDSITPGTSVLFDTTFKNNANEVLEGLDVYVTSSVFSEEQDKITLYALKDLNKEYKIEVPSSTAPGKYSLSIRVYDSGILKGVYTKAFVVGESTELKEKSAISKGFLSSVVSISKTNDGNTELEKVVKYPTNWFKRIFTGVEPDAEIVVENWQKFYQWSFVLKPGESYEIKIKSDYKILFIVIVVILGIIALRLYYKRRTISIEKKIFKISDTSGVSDLKILLHIKNCTNKEIHHINVIDLLPEFIRPGTDFGTLKPISIQHGSHGMRLVWEINSLEIGEERIISYKVHSKLHVVGNISLPPASVQYRTRGKRIVNVKSNRLDFVAKNE